VKAKNVVTLEVDDVMASSGIGAEGVSHTNTHDPLYVGGVPGRCHVNLSLITFLIVRSIDNKACGYVKDFSPRIYQQELEKTNVGQLFETHSRRRQLFITS